MNLRIIRVIIVILCMTTVLSIGHVAHSKSLEDVDFEDTYTVDEIILEFKGAGTIRHMRFFTVNATALYIGRDFEAQDVFKDIPKRLEFEYFYDIKAKDFVKLTNTWIARNNSPETISRLQPRIDSFNALYNDVQSGDRYAITYIPGKGTTLALNGEIRGTIPGSDFAEALFSIWLGEKPVSKSLKNSLLK